MQLDTISFFRLFKKESILVVGNSLSSKEICNNQIWCEHSTTLIVFNHGPSHFSKTCIIKNKKWKNVIYVCAAEEGQNYQNAFDAFFDYKACKYYVFFNHPFCQETNTFRHNITHKKLTSYAVIDEQIERKIALKDFSSNMILSSGAFICSLISHYGYYKELRVGGMDCFTHTDSLHFYEKKKSHTHDENTELKEWREILKRKNVLFDTTLMNLFK